MGYLHCGRYRHDADNNTDVGRSRNAASTLILHKFFILGYNINISLSGDEVQWWRYDAKNSIFFLFFFFIFFPIFFYLIHEGEVTDYFSGGGDPPKNRPAGNPIGPSIEIRTLGESEDFRLYFPMLTPPIL